MPRKRKTTETPNSQEQPYDSSFKALLDDQTTAMLSFLLGEEVLLAYELKESVFKRETVKPALRVDCAYVVRSRKYGQERIRTYIVHIEFETAPTSEIEKRLFEYYALLDRKHDRPIVQILVCPFQTPNLPLSPYRICMEDGEVLQKFRYRAMALWRWEAIVLLVCGQVELFALLPAMKGATYAVLSEGLKAMRAFYAGDESRLITHLLWFGTLLTRTTTVSEKDKERIRAEMSDFESIHDVNPFVQKRMIKARTEGRAEGLAEGFAEGEAKGEAKGLQEAVVFAVELRFPTLLELAQQKAERVKEPEVLKFVLRGLKAAQNEEAARLLLDTLVA